MEMIMNKICTETEGASKFQLADGGGWRIKPQFVGASRTDGGACSSWLPTDAGRPHRIPLVVGQLLQLPKGLTGV